MSTHVRQPSLTLARLQTNKPNLLPS